MRTINIGGKKIICDDGENLYKALLRGGINFNASCGGVGTCGKCYVDIDGVGRVKACQYSVKEDIALSLSVQKIEALTKGMLRDVKADNKAACIAADIGTTTVVAYLIKDGKIKDAISSVNSQKPYGDDVITRIKYTIDNEDGTDRLHSLIKNQIKQMVSELSERNGALVSDMAIVGNTTMLHLFAGVSPASMGVAPYTPKFTELKKIGNATLLPSLSAYVGADTVAAILASGMHLSDKKCLLIDIGTNGEIALGNRDKIITCSAAAGPAFEGAQISCGTGGVAGAIDSVKINGGITYTTIGGLPPVGICGSGILDTVAQMLKAGHIDSSGYFEDEILYIADGVSITANDIRQVQLAKAAIAAGIGTLVELSKTDLSEIEVCYLAGGFGSFLNKQSACDIGLIPKELLDRVVPIGNAAGMGAVLWSVSDECKKEVQGITDKAEYFELSESSIFNRLFIENMAFE
ncbi:MAG: hypothetical protein BWY15_00952 [Firmicutes bacterium ADurb.Bin193]|nr:MAG: hypothetical protein BWY15_00952 [Firmicutes bacterium ADurb.Bin193]